jgi:outer membrane immunogenic protein
MSRKLLCVIGVSALLIAAPLSTASAADMLVKAPPPPPPSVAFNWTGFYVGIEGGGGWGHAEDTDALPFDSGRFAVTGGLIGGTLGYNWQFNRIVLGLEGDGSAAWIKGTTVGTLPFPPFGNCGGLPPHCDSDLRALGTFRARAGVTFDKFLPYMTGGLAVGSLHGHEGDTLANGAVGNATTTVTGWTVGGGIEAAFAPNWSAKVEYLHVDFGNHAIFNDIVPLIPPASIVLAEHVRYTTEILRVGLNYKFNWAAPVVAKY